MVNAVGIIVYWDIIMREYDYVCVGSRLKNNRAIYLYIILIYCCIIYLYFFNNILLYLGQYMRIFAVCTSAGTCRWKYIIVLLY